MGTGGFYFVFGRKADLEFEAIQRAQKAGHLFVASAGNHNLNTDLPEWV